MKGKILLVGAVAIIGGTGIALHMGHKPKCPFRNMIEKRVPETKPVAVSTAHLNADHKKPAQ